MDRTQWEEFERMGEPSVRAQLEMGTLKGTRTVLEAREWLHFKEGIRQKTDGEIKFATMKANVAAAESARQSADSAADAAKATQDAAKWAMWAAVIAVVALILALAKN
jgi:hypothetical protein